MSVNPDPPEQLYARFPRRLKAATLDAVILAAILVAGLELLEWLEPIFEVANGWLIGLMAVLLSYEPVFIWLHGRTLGHRAFNIHVVADTPSGRLPFWKALLRSGLKLLTGISAFATMPVTRRHQALHDLGFGTTVCIFDRRSARLDHYVIERAPSQSHRLMPSRVRRLVVSLGYLVLLLLGLVLALVGSLSAECTEFGRCDSSESLVEHAVTILWLASSFVAVVLVWQGRLPGARRRVDPAGGALALSARGGRSR